MRTNKPATNIGDVGAKVAIAVPGAQMVDLQGRTLIPGFNDAPVHVASLGMLLTKYVDVRVHHAPNIPAVLARLTERTEREPVGTWIQGVGYNEALLTESRHLTRNDLRWSSLLTSRTRYPPVAKFVM